MIMNFMLPMQDRHELHGIVKHNIYVIYRAYNVILLLMKFNSYHLVLKELPRRVMTKPLKQFEKFTVQEQDGNQPAYYKMRVL